MEKLEGRIKKALYTGGKGHGPLDVEAFFAERRAEKGGGWMEISSTDMNK